MYFRGSVSRRYLNILLSAGLLAGILAFVRPVDVLSGMGRFPLATLLGALFLIVVNQIAVVHRWTSPLKHRTQSPS